MEVRPVRPEEYEEAGRVTALAYREYAIPGDEGWDEYLIRIADVASRADRTVVLVAVEDGRVLGSATIEMWTALGDDDKVIPPETAVLRMLGVDSAARRRGVARALVHGVIRATREEGKSELLLRTTEQMIPAQRLYASMGFQRVPDRDMWVDDDTYLMAYVLPLA